MTAAEKIKEMGIVPVVVLEDEKDAGALAKALCEGGLPCAEVTFRTAAAKESIRIMLEEYPEFLPQSRWTRPSAQAPVSS